MVKKYIKEIKNDENVRNRSLGFILDTFWWFIFLLLGWWLRGFSIDYYGENLTLSETLVKIIRESGGIKEFMIFLGSFAAVIVKLKAVFRKRNGDGKN